jgi:O-antigen ligase
VKSNPAAFFSQTGWEHWRSIKPAAVVAPLVVGFVLAALLLTFGPIALPIVFSLVFILPWLLKDTFRLFVWLIISWPVLSLFVRIPLPGGIPDISYDRVLALVLVCIVVVEALLSKRQLVKASPLDILIMLYVAAQLGTRLSVVWFGGVGTPDLNGFLDAILVPVLLCWAARNVVGSKQHLQWLLYALVIASLLVCITGLIEQALGVRIFKASLSLGGSEVNYQWRDAQGQLRAAGALANPAIYGAFLGMGSLAGICALPLVQRKLARAALLATIAVLLYGVFASYTRSAWLSAFVVLFAAQFFLNGLWKKMLPIVMLGSVLLMLVWNLIPNHAGILQRALTTKTIDQRLDLFEIGWTRFLERPLFGWGSGALNRFGVLGEGNISHDIYLTFLVDGGVILLLSFVLVAGYLLAKAARAYGLTQKGAVERSALVAMTGCVAIYLLSGLALELRYFGYFNAMFWIGAGIIDLLGTRRSSEEEPHG